jgi:rubrerythrin
MTTIPGASVWEQELFDHVDGHATAEQAILDDYRALADDEEAAPATRYIARLILDDEMRHHRMFLDLAESIRQMGELRVENEPIPTLTGLRADADRVLDVTERLLAVERDDAKELKSFAKQLADVRDTTLWGLLVEIMRHDTEKHIMILQFLRDRAKAAR